MEELFAGPRAEEAKMRALNIANMFEFRLRGRGRARGPAGAHDGFIVYRKRALRRPQMNRTMWAGL